MFFFVPQAISYLLAEAVNGTTQFKEDYLNVLERTSIGTDNMNVLINSVESLLSELKCEVSIFGCSCLCMSHVVRQNSTSQ